MSSPPSSPRTTGTPRIPTIDLRPWLDGDPDARTAIARTVDEALQSAGFSDPQTVLDPALRSRIREAARCLLIFPTEVKQPYAVQVGGLVPLPGCRGQRLLGGYADASRPQGVADLRDARALRGPVDQRGVVRASKRAAHRGPELRKLCEEYLAGMVGWRTTCWPCWVRPSVWSRTSSPATWATRRTASTSTGTRGRRSSASPSPASSVSAPTPTSAPSPSSDRQAGKGGLQVYTDEGGWEDAPFDPAAFTINIGDLMARWTG